MKIKASDLPGVSQLYIDYIQDFPRLAEFFAQPYADDAHFMTQKNLVEKQKHSRDELGAILKAQNDRFGAGEATLQNIHRLASGKANVIITGQQVGLFGGPFYVLYKILTAIKLCDRLSRHCQNCFVPVFWLAADDTDFAEINHAWIAGRNGGLQRLEIPRTQSGNIPAAAHTLPEGIVALIEALANATPETEFKETVLSRLKACYRPGVSMSDSFGRWLMDLLHTFGVIFVDPTEPKLKALAADIFSREIAERSPSTREAMRTSAALSKAGYTPQVPLREGFLNVFYMDGERHALALNNEKIESTDGKFQFTVEALLRTSIAHPEKFSPNVILRGLAQDRLLPTIAYVAGPAEIAYFAQLSGVYRDFGIPMPIIYPRKSVTLLEPAIDRILDKYGLNVPQIWSGIDDFLTATARANLPDSLLAGLEKIRSEWPAQVLGMRHTIAAIDPTLEKMVEATAGRISHALDTLEKKVVQAGKRQNDLARQQLLKAATSLLPEHNLQERIYNFTPYLIKYGPHLISRLYEALDISSFEHQILRL